jgi:hypothetical protein
MRLLTIILEQSSKVAATYPGAGRQVTMALNPKVVGVWIDPDGGTAQFRTAREDGPVVIGGGRIRFGPRAPAAPAAQAPAA